MDFNGVKQFLIDNREMFEKLLLEEAVTVRDKIEEIKLLGNINLLENAHKLVVFAANGEEEDVIDFGKQEGIAWAKHALTLELKLEWVQAIRVTLWNIIENYDKLRNESWDKQDFFALGKQINNLIDKFFKGFFLSYVNFKDGLLESQRKLVENLSVPIIPISASVSILPLIGTMEDLRIHTIEEKVLMAIGEKAIQTLIIDLSGIATMDYQAIGRFMKLIDGITMMGCKTIITGIRPEVVKIIVTQDMGFGRKIEHRATLQQALKDYLKTDQIVVGKEVSTPTPSMQ